MGARDGHSSRLNHARLVWLAPRQVGVGRKAPKNEGGVGVGLQAEAGTPPLSLLLEAWTPLSPFCVKVEAGTLLML